jgi:hypothetical protein
MPTDTVEYTETVQKEETVTWCSDCGREVDEKGREFNDGDISVHFCSECLPLYADNEFESEKFRKVKEWQETKVNHAGNSIKRVAKSHRVFSLLSVLGWFIFGVGLLFSNIYSIGVGATISFIFTACLVITSHLITRADKVFTDE